MKHYGRLFIALMVAIIALIPLGGSVSLNNGPAIKVEGPDSLEGVATMEATIILATGQIQTAVNNADPGDIIFLWPKKYYDNVVVDKDLNIRGSGKLLTIVDGQKQGSVFTIPQGVIATLSSMTIQNGNTDIQTSFGMGGGILNQGTLTVENCDIHHNYAELYGGAIENLGQLTVLNSEIHHNEAGDTTGGIDNYEVFGPGTATTTLKGCWIHKNNVVIDGGLDLAGGVGNWEGSMKIYNCKIDHNNAYLGGGIHNHYGDMVIDGSFINHNTADLGGGICNEWGNLIIDSSKIMSNAADDNGGGIYSLTQAYDGYGSLAVSKSNIMYNIADADHDGNGLGGGIYWSDSSEVPVSPTLRYNWIAGNSPDQVYPAI